MPLSQQCFDLRLSKPHRLVRFSLDQDVCDRLAINLTRAPHQTQLRRRDRDEDDIVLILASTVLSFLRENADHFEWDTRDPDLFTNRIIRPEQLLRDRLSDQRHLSAALFL